MEFALVVPLLLLVLVLLVEAGRMLSHKQTLEKGLRAGATYATRATLPLDADTETRIGNLVRYGNLNGTGALLIDGWAAAAAHLDIDTQTQTVGGADIAVILLDASVPYQPILPGLIDMFGLGSSTLTAHQELIHVGR